MTDYVKVPVEALEALGFHDTICEMAAVNQLRQILTLHKIREKQNAEFDARYPELAKESAAKQAGSQILGEFIGEFLPSRGLVLCTSHDQGCRFMPAYQTISSLLADFFDIDERKAEEERRDLLEGLHMIPSVEER